MQRLGVAAFVLALSLNGAGFAADWSHWRGPFQTGVSPEKDLVSTWSQEGKNLLWRVDFMGRSTPIVQDGRVYVIGRTGKDITEQTHVASYDAESGEMIWEDKLNVFHTTIPFNRVGWANPAGDPKTGHIYVHTVQGIFNCYDRDGNVVWSRSLTEEYGRISGYGGRTNTPFVHGDLVILSYLNTSWGDQGPPRHRFFAFDKMTGEVVWIWSSDRPPKDTTYSTPIVMNVNGRELLVAGNADGYVYALDIQTGRKVWGFGLSKRGLNVSVVASGNYVYAAHSEENLDSAELGRVVCIDATGTGDVTETHEVWRLEGETVGYASPVLHEGRLYVVDNSANMMCVNAKTGEVIWEHSIGTVGKGSPVYGDGKLYATEVNGGFEIIDISDGKPVTLDRERIERVPNVHAEIFGSPAISNGRVYFTTGEGLYCLGTGKAGPHVTVPPRPRPAFDASLPPALVQVRPAEIAVTPGASVTFTAHLFNDLGQEMWQTQGTWGMKELRGTPGNGTVTVSPDVNGQTGLVTFRTGELEGSARVRVVPELPYEEDFDDDRMGTYPAFWVGAAGKFKVVDLNGENVLVKPPAARALHRSYVFVGPSDASGYTIQADLMGTKDGRIRSDVGLISHRYTLDMMGNHQRLQVRSWASDLRMARTIDFEWAPDVWYTMKMKVEQEPDKTVILGKVWPRDASEPTAWTIRAEDPLPIREGSPGIYGYSPTNVYYDNIRIW